MHDYLESFRRTYEQAHTSKLLSKSWYDHFKHREIKDMDELEIAAHELVYAQQHAEYYIILDRIEKGEDMRDAETDEEKKAGYTKLLNELTQKLETLRPKVT